MTVEQIFSLFVMMCLGLPVLISMGNWKAFSRRRRIFALVWVIFWLGPPLYFIWTKGVLG